MCREREEWSAGRSRRRGERLGRAQDEPKSALQADKVETSKNYQGKVNDPAVLNRGHGTHIRRGIYRLGHPSDSLPGSTAEAKMSGSAPWSHDVRARHHWNVFRFHCELRRIRPGKVSWHEN